MSYILDALKRADQERKQGEVPDLRSVPPVAPPHEDRGRHKLLAAIIVASLAVALFWLKPWESKEPEKMNSISLQQPAPVVATAAPEPVASRLPEPMASETAEPFQRTRALEVITPQTEVTVAKPVLTEQKNSAEKPAGIPGIMELPAHIQSTLPTIKISGHIFDENPASRMVIINDRVMREGRYISDSVSIEEITESGIILNSSGTLFTMSTFDSWPR